MWKRKEIAVSSSSVVDLKAELFRKKEEFEKAKLQGDTTLRPVSTKPIKKPPKNKGVEQRAQRDQHSEPETIGATLESSWVALQRKAKLYEKLAQEGGSLEDDEKEDGALVDFLQKTIEGHDVTNEDDSTPEISADDPWVEAVDEFGRTRIVRRSQVSELGLRFQKAGESVTTAGDDQDEGPSLLSDDMRREMERQQWEEEARKELDAPHFDSKREIRTLGVGFYQFSQDEEERKHQMEELKGMRDETLVNRQAAAKMRDSRKEKLEERRRLLKERAQKRRKLDSSGSPEVSQDKDLDNTVDAFLSGIRNRVPRTSKSNEHKSNAGE
ncbi:hypothetical protein BC832DRAFT_593978 [Gaertneriomyces semiglobifer]|nr:hypothetical protein BC832DRAFT_593978 [Gaertneriomyces semiglobifer]